MKLSWPFGRAVPLSSQCPPALPLSQKSYCVGGSPSASDAVNREEAATALLWPETIELLLGITTGALLTVKMLTVVRTGGLRLKAGLPSLTTQVMVRVGLAPALVVAKVTLSNTL